MIRKLFGGAFLLCYWITGSFVRNVAQTHLLSISKNYCLAWCYNYFEYIL